jgi:wyosine [tRNA(Phe)-imidazoG37] synthetase (radical SAM superfamily)
MINLAESPIASAPARSAPGTEFGWRRDFLDNRFVYVVVSPRARGLSVGINLNPDKHCNFNCAYCEVDRSVPGTAAELDLSAMATELEFTLNLISSGALLQRRPYARLSPQLARLRHVALSGDGEPTLSPHFLDAVQTVMHLRARHRVSFFKIVLITNASRLEEEQVCAALRLFTKQDEVWAKLDGGTQKYLNRINAPDLSVERIRSGILRVARKRPVIIQSLFPLLEGSEPPAAEIVAYADRLNALKKNGAQISLVQVYSASRPPADPKCGHLALKSLSAIARTVRELTGLNVQVY